MKLSIFLTTVLFSLSLFAVSLSGPVVDQAGVFSRNEKAVVSSAVMNYYKQTGVQFQILTVKTLDGVPIEDFSINLAEKWKIGGKGGKGVIIIAAIKDRKMRIEVGNGLEGELPDVICGRIIAEIIAPQFRNGSYAAGFAGAIEFMSGRLGKKIAFSGNSIKRTYKRRRKRGFSFIFFFIFLFIFRGLMFRRGGGGLLTGMLLGSMLGGSGRHGGGGSFGGGGWSGGGGGFSGGGASGGW